MIMSIQDKLTKLNNIKQDIRKAIQYISREDPGVDMNNYSEIIKKSDYFTKMNLKKSSDEDLSYLPDLQKIYIAPEESVYYLTYDNVVSQEDNYFAEILSITNNGTAKLEWGHIENNEFIVDSLIQDGVTINQKVTGAIPMNRQYPIMKISTTTRLQCSGNQGISYSFEDKKYRNESRRVIDIRVNNTKGIYCLSNCYTKRISIENCPDFTFYAAFGNNTNLVDLKFKNVKREVGSQSAGVFQGCRMLKKIDLRETNFFDTSTLQSMFAYCNSLEEILYDKEIPKATVTEASGLFQDCYMLKKIPDFILNMDCSSIAYNMGSVFSGCWSLEELDLSNWNLNPQKVTYLDYWFSQCFNLTKIVLPKYWADNVKLTGTLSFNQLWSLKEIVNYENLDISNLTNCQAMFSGCFSLKELDLSNWEINGRCDSLFQQTYSLQKLKLGTINIPENYPTIESMFNGCRNLKEIDLSGLNCDYPVRATNLFSECYKLKKITLPILYINSGYGIFNGCYELEEVNSENLYGKPNTLQNMFVNCYSIKTINLSNLDTSECTTFQNLFYQCRSLQEIIGIKNWDISKCTNLSYAFYYMISLPELNLNWGTSNVTNFTNMYYFNRMLKKINLPNFDYSKSTTNDNAFLDWQYFKLTHYKVKKFSPNFNLVFKELYNLTGESIQNIIDALPQITTSRTISLVQYRLSDAQKAQITEKGWTLTS